MCHYEPEFITSNCGRIKMQLNHISNNATNEKDFEIKFWLQSTSIPSKISISTYQWLSYPFADMVIMNSESVFQVNIWESQIDTRSIYYTVLVTTSDENFNFAKKRNSNINESWFRLIEMQLAVWLVVRTMRPVPDHSSRKNEALSS